MPMTQKERLEHMRRIGSIGGQTTSRRYGHTHYSLAGEKGAAAMMAKYGREHYVMAGKKSAAAKKARKGATGNQLVISKPEG